MAMNVIPDEVIEIRRLPACVELRVYGGVLDDVLLVEPTISEALDRLSRLAAFREWKEKKGL
jgi:hypothetical protein